MSDEYIFEGFEPANTTPVPDVLFDELLSELNGTELKVLLYIIRRTIGFKKGSDSISLTQFEKGIVTRDGRRLDSGCGLSDRKAIRRALNSLEEKKCIIRERNINDSNEYDTTTYRVRFKGEGVGANPPQPRGQIHPNLGGESTPTVGANSPQRVGANSPQRVGANSPHTINSITIDSLQETVLQNEVSFAHASTDDAPNTTPQEKESSPEEPDVSYSEPPTEEPPSPPAKEEKPKRTRIRRTRASRSGFEIPEELRPRVEAVYACLDAWRQKVTGDPEERFIRDDEGNKAICELFQGKPPTKDRLELICDGMWNQPRNERTGYYAREHMTIRLICNEYKAKAMLISVKSPPKQIETDNPGTTPKPISINAVKEQIERMYGGKYKMLGVK